MKMTHAYRRGGRLHRSGRQLAQSLHIADRPVCVGVGVKREWATRLKGICIIFHTNQSRRFMTEGETAAPAGVYRWAWHEHVVHSTCRHVLTLSSACCCAASVDPILFDSSLGASSADCMNIHQKDRTFTRTCLPIQRTGAGGSLRARAPAAGDLCARPRAPRRSCRRLV